MATKIDRTAGSAWTPPTSPQACNYPLNCWWVAAFSNDVGRELLGRWLLDTPVLLYRTGDGRAVAVENRCPHRGAPLSLGCLIGDEVQCGCHGFRFDEDGANTFVPSMREPLGAARIRAFPLVEQPPYIWIYLGDPARIAAVPPPPVLEWADDPSFALVHGRMDIPANYMLLKENVLDLTHFGFVQATTFKITDWVDPPTFGSGEDMISCRQVFTRSPLPPVFAEPLGIPPGTPYDRENGGSFVSPAPQRAAVDLREPATGEVTGRFRVAHATTPIDAASMHYFWVAARDHGTSADSMEALETITRIGFAEDEAMIEAIQAMADRDPRRGSPPETSVKMDTAGIQARRIVQRWMARETAGC